MAKVSLRDPSAGLQTLFILQASSEHWVLPFCCEGAWDWGAATSSLGIDKNPRKKSVCGALPRQAGCQVAGTGFIPLQENHWIHLSAIITLSVIQ